MVNRDKTLVEDLDRRLDVALRNAVNEATLKGWPNLAKALDAMRETTMQWRQNALERLQELGIYSMTPQQYNLWLDMMSRALAERAVQEAKLAEQERSRAWWQSTAVKVGIIASAVSLVTVAISSLYALLFGGTHPLLHH